MRCRVGSVGRPSAGTVIAVLALCVAVGGGTAFAVSQLDGKNIQKASIPGNRLESNGVRGKQIRESSLKVVPMAKATKQLQVARKRKQGKARLLADSPSGSPSLVRMSIGDKIDFFQKGPITITGECEQPYPEGDTRTVLTVLASVSSGNAFATQTRQKNESTEITPGNPADLYYQDSYSGDPVFERFDPLTVAASSGDTLTLGPPAFGVHVLGADCVAVMYAVG
jgi:hypothetical protein